MTAHVRHVVGVFVFAWFVACGGRSAPAELLHLEGLEPASVEVGDRVIVRGRDLPAAQDIRRITLTLRGSLARPGLPSCGAPTEVTLSDPPPGATVNDAATGALRDRTYAESGSRTIRVTRSDQIEFVMTGPLMASLTQCPGARADAEITVPHATLALGATGSSDRDGGLTLRIEGLTGGRDVSGTLRGATLDLEAPPSLRLTMEASARDAADRALAFLGLALVPTQPDEGGVRIASVRPGSRAEQAGLASNDVITRADGVIVRGPMDLRPAAGAATTVFSVLRGGVEDDHTLSLEGYVPSAPLDLVGAAILLLVLATLLMVYLGPASGTFVWWQQQIARARPAASRAPFFAWWVGVCREGFRGARTEIPSALAAAPYLPAVFVAAVGIAVLAADRWTHLRADVSYALLAAVVLRAVAFGALSSPEHPMRFHRLRAVLRVFVASIPATVALAAVVWGAGGIQPASLAASQGGFPWEWNLFRTPASWGLAALFALAIVDLPGAPAPRSRFYSVAHAFDWGALSLFAWLGAVAFLGGWQIPGVTLEAQLRSVPLTMGGAAWCVAKTSALLVAILWLRWWAPRARWTTWAARTTPTLGLWGVVALGAHFAWLRIASHVPTLMRASVGSATFMLALSLCAVLWVRHRVGTAPIGISRAEST